MRRNHLNDAHWWTTINVLQKQLSICTHTSVITFLSTWAGSAELKYSVKIQIQKRPGELIHGVVDCSEEWSIRYNLFWLIWKAFSISSHLIVVWICFSRHFPHIDGPSFSPYKPLQNVCFYRSVTCSFFSGIALTYWQELRRKDLKMCFLSE